MNVHPFPFSVHQIVAALGGQVTGPDTCNVPGPGHSAKDKSLSIKIDPTAPDGFLVYSHAGDDGIECKDWIRQTLGLPQWTASRKADASRSWCDGLRLQAGRWHAVPPGPPHRRQAILAAKLERP